MFNEILTGLMNSFRSKAPQNLEALRLILLVKICAFLRLRHGGCNPEKDAPIRFGLRQRASDNPVARIATDFFMIQVARTGLTMLVICAAAAGSAEAQPANDD